MACHQILKCYICLCFAILVVVIKRLANVSTDFITNFNSEPLGRKSGSFNFHLHFSLHPASQEHRRTLAHDTLRHRHTHSDADLHANIHTHSDTHTLAHNTTSHMHRLTLGHRLTNTVTDRRCTHRFASTQAHIHSLFQRTEVSAAGVGSTHYCDWTLRDFGKNLNLEQCQKTEKCPPCPAEIYGAQ